MTWSMDETLETKKFTEFGEDADFHGIKHVVRAENGMVRRVVWTVLLITSLVVLIYNTTQQLIIFFQYPHNTIYDIEFVHDLDFPSITICNVNKHRRSAFTQFDILKMGTHLGMTNNSNDLIHPELYDSSWVSTMFTGTNWNAVEAANAGREFDLTEFFNRTGHQKEDLIQHCQWKSNTCNESSWETVFTHYGKCYMFNKDGNHLLKKAGAGNGLKLVLYDEEEEYIESHDSEDLGVKFLPHAHIEPPFLKELGFGAAPGYHYQIALQQREIKGLGKPYTECEEDHATDYFDHYTIPGCRIECETKAIYEECGCRLVESPGTHPVCTPEQFDCAEEKLVEIEQSDSCLCENPCSATQYPFKISMLELREATIDKLKNDHPIPANLTKDQLVVLNIYFDSLSFESVEMTKAYTVLSILSDFGGTMGLWLGASILAAVQMADYCIMKCIYCCCTKKHNKTNVKPMTSPEAKNPSEGPQSVL